MKYSEGDIVWVSYSKDDSFRDRNRLTFCCGYVGPAKVMEVYNGYCNLMFPIEFDISEHGVYPDKFSDCSVNNEYLEKIY
jgi:hypothetical protein